MRARKWTLAGLAGSVVLGCAAGAAPAQVPPTPAAVVPANPAAKPAAMVNGEAIPMADLEAALKRQGPEPTVLPERIKVANRRAALAMLIDETLRHQHLRKVSAPVARGEVEKKMAEMAEILKTQGKTLDEYYKEANQTPDGLRTAIAYELQWTALCNARATDEALLKYYTDNKDFFDGVMVNASHIALRVAPAAPEAEVAAARAKLTTLRAQILEKKVDFAQAAKASSECIDSAAHGGEIGCISRKGIDEAFARAAFSLQPGQVSDVVQTGFGLHLITVTERKPGAPSDFKTAKEKVRLVFLDELEETILAELRKGARIEITIP